MICLVFGLFLLDTGTHSVEAEKERIRLELVSISFDHEENSHDQDALTIRENKNEPIDPPEYESGADVEPVAFVKETAPDIEFKFRIKPNVENMNGSFTIYVNQKEEFLPIGPGGKPEKLEMEVKNGELTEPVRTVSAGSVGKEIRKEKVEIDFRVTEEEFNDMPDPNLFIPDKDDPAVIKEIYVVLDKPYLPWNEEGKEKTQPWAELLREVTEWDVQNESDPKEVVNILQKRLYHNFGWMYDYVKGASSFSQPQLQWENQSAPDIIANVNMEKLVYYLIEKKDAEKVNCYDMATALATTGNLLGTKQKVYYLQNFGYLNMNKPVGGFHSNNPYPSSEIMNIEEPNDNEEDKWVYIYPDNALIVPGDKIYEDGIGKDENQETAITKAKNSGGGRTIFGNHMITVLDGSYWDPTMMIHQDGKDHDSPPFNDYILLKAVDDKVDYLNLARDDDILYGEYFGPYHPLDHPLTGKAEVMFNWD